VIAARAGGRSMRRGPVRRGLFVKSGADALLVCTICYAQLRACAFERGVTDALVELLPRGVFGVAGKRLRLCADHAADYRDGDVFRELVGREPVIAARGGAM